METHTQSNNNERKITHSTSVHIYTNKRDNLTLYLSQDILNHIFKFIPPNLRSFALFTCSFWYHTIRNMEDFMKMNAKDQSHLASLYGYLSYLKYVYLNTGKLDSKNLESAALGGNLECMKFAYESGTTWTAEVSMNAARNGHLDCLKYAHENGCGWNRANKEAETAAVNGHVACLEYCLPFYEGKSICAYAAQGGSLECLKLAHSKGYELANCLFYAAMNGHLNCMKYAFENGCPWMGSECPAAAYGKHFECLKYAHENGCNLMADTICDDAANGGDVECLKYAVEQGGTLDDRAVISAATHGRLDCLKYLHSLGCKISSEALLRAARNGHLKCLKYANENGAIGPLAAWHAASNGHAKCVEYSLKYIPDIDKHDVANQAARSNLACLKVAHENGCSLDLSTLIIAANSGNLDCLKYTHEVGGVKWGKFSCENLVAVGCLKKYVMLCVKYAYESGCEWPEYAQTHEGEKGKELECMKEICGKTLCNMSSSCPYFSKKKT